MLDGKPLNSRQRQRFHWSPKRHSKQYCTAVQHRSLELNCAHTQGNHSCGGQGGSRCAIPGATARLPLIVVEENGPSLLGCDWWSTICLDWKSINTVKSKKLVGV